MGYPVNLEFLSMKFQIMEYKKMRLYQLWETTYLKVIFRIHTKLMDKSYLL